MFQKLELTFKQPNGNGAPTLVTKLMKDKID